jgi:AAA15 family ATPase/GTPase
MKAISELRLDGLLSFAPGSPSFGLQSLNVLIGPNGSGKSNVIEAIELLKATPEDFARDQRRRRRCGMVVERALTLGARDNRSRSRGFAGGEAADTLPA